MNTTRIKIASLTKSDNCWKKIGSQQLISVQISHRKFIKNSHCPCLPSHTDSRTMTSQTICYIKDVPTHTWMMANDTDYIPCLAMKRTQELALRRKSKSSRALTDFSKYKRCVTQHWQHVWMRIHCIHRRIRTRRKPFRHAIQKLNPELSSIHNWQQ
jgi:hypothetical protein